MPKSEIEALIDKATNENNVVEDWGLIMDICDQINHLNSKKEIIKIFIKKMNDKDPHVIEHSLTLLNACVSNCDRNFKLEVSSRIFVEEMRSFILKKRFEKLSRTMANMLEKWTKEAEFKNDPAFSLIQTLYMELKKQGVDFNLDVAQVTTTKAMKQELLDKREEEELAKAIQLSLKESQAKTPSSSSIKSNGSNPSSSSSLFGQLMQNTQSISESYGSKTTSTTTPTSSSSSSQRRRVKALYDFEAAEDNEITFKAGDILFLSDDSDPNWWKGFDMNGFEGLFPSNFVTFDLNEKIEVFDAKSNSMKKVSFNDNVDVNLIQNADAQQKKTISIDEKKIDDCIELLQNADPTGEIQPDSQELLELEEECYMMGPLIDKKLQEIDEQHATLEDLNLKILEAFQLYNNLMKESISKQTALLSNSQLPPQQQQQNQPPVMMNPAATNGGINYAAAPPQIEANSLAFANKLNSLAYGPTAAVATNGGGYGLNHQPSGFALPTNTYPPNMYTMQGPNGVDMSQPTTSLGAPSMIQYPPPQQQQQQQQQPPQQYFTSS